MCNSQILPRRCKCAMHWQICIRAISLLAVGAMLADSKGSRSKRVSMETRQSNAAKAREASVHKWQVDLPMARKASGLEVGVVFRPDNCKQFTRLGNRIKLHYETRLQATGEVIDSTFRRTTARNPSDPKAGSMAAALPSELDIVEGHVLHGWAEGIPGMCVGEIRQLVLPPDLGYGDQRMGPIPGGSVLECYIEVVEVVRDQAEPWKPEDGIRMDF